MLEKILILIVLTIIPFIELRLAIPAGILVGTLSLPFNLAVTGLGMHPLIVFPVVVITNFLVGVVLFHLIHYFDLIFRNSFLKKYYARTLDRTQRKIHPYVEKYGILGAAIFIGLPLPGSGVYSGSLGSYIVGLTTREFYKACALGVVIAGTIVTILTVSGMAIFA